MKDHQVIPLALAFFIFLIGMHQCTNATVHVIQERKDFKKTLEAVKKNAIESRK